MAVILCKNCNIETNRKGSKVLFCSNSCRGKFYRQNTKFNAEYFKEKKKEWYAKNKMQELLKIRAYQITNKSTIADKHNQYIKNRKLVDSNFKLACTLRTRLNKVIKFNLRKGSAIKDLGCSLDDLKLYIESKFYSNMTWENHGKIWHIDHIKPLKSFDLTIIEKFKEACHFTNLQPLLTKDHVLKTTKEILDK